MAGAVFRDTPCLPFSMSRHFVDGHFADRLRTDTSWTEETAHILAALNRETSTISMLLIKISVHHICTVLR